jgi:hypothetical protein
MRGEHIETLETKDLYQTEQKRFGAGRKTSGRGAMKQRTHFKTQEGRETINSGRKRLDKRPSR